jgi:hypothetical protein
MFAGNPNGLRHWNDLARMYNVMTTKLGYSAADITVLYGDGTGKMSNGTQSPVPVNAAATRANLQNTIKNVAKKMNSSNTLLFWVSDHGDLDPGIRDIPTTVSPHGAYTFQFDLYPAYIQAVSISESSPDIEIAQQGVTGYDTVAINNVTVGSLQPLSNTTTLYFGKNTISLSPYGNTFAITSSQATNFTIYNITLSSGSVNTQILSRPVGGIAVPVDKLPLFASYIGLASTAIIGAMATAVCVRRVKRGKEKQ